MRKVKKASIILSVVILFLLTAILLLLNPIRTLSTFQKHEQHPLFTMTYFGGYDYLLFTIPHSDEEMKSFSRNHLLYDEFALLENQACTIFSATGGEEKIYGRNRDMGQENLALVLYTDPPDGYKSISLVDLNQFGTDPGSFSLSYRLLLLAAPLLPTEGMNEHGLTIAKADVSINNMQADPEKQPLFFRSVMREVLDHAKTTQEAIEILDNFNIYFGSTGGHFLIADPSGDSAIVEFYDNNMHVLRSADSWQVITNFCLGKAIESKETPTCERFLIVEESLTKKSGVISMSEAMDLLEDASVPNTIWSVVFNNVIK